jgi:hypothetical protein
MAIPVPVRMKYYVHLCCTEFHADWTINMESTDKNLFPPVSKVQLSLHRFSVTKQIFVDIYTKFFPTQINREESMG